jgi:hypothetical protein
MGQVDDKKVLRGKVFKILDLGGDFVDWRALRGCCPLSISCQRTAKKFDTGNAFVSGDGRIS